MALTTATTSDALAAGAGDVVGHGPDALGVADGRSPELLDDQWHPDEANGWTSGIVRQGPRRSRPDIGLGDPRPLVELARVSGRAQRQASPPASRPRGAPGRRGQAQEAAATDPQCGDRRRGGGGHRRHRLRRVERQQPTRARRAATSTTSSSTSSTTSTTTAGQAANAKLQAQADAIAVKAGCPASTSTRVNTQHYTSAPPMTIDTSEDLHRHRR